MSGPSKTDVQHIRRIEGLLEKEYGTREWSPDRTGIEVLIETILSQNTNDRNSHRAFENLVERFQGWDAVGRAPRREVEKAIRVAGLAPTKAGRIQHILRTLAAERGACSLDFLADMERTEAMAYLCSLPGVGTKTAACVLLFAFNRPVFPVDTHIWRVTKRLGLIPQETDRQAAQRLLQEMIPPDAVYPLHLLLIELGRRICHARRPNHSACVLRRLCPSADII